MWRGFAALVASVALVLPSLAGATHPRPKSATPIVVSLTPAYEPCVAPDRTHGPPLAFPSCSGPTQTSGYLTVGNPPSSGANMTGQLRIRGITGTPGPPEDSYLIYTARISDVRCKAVSAGCSAPGADYVGTLGFAMTVRATDHYTCTPPPDPCSPVDPGTVEDFTVRFDVPCAATGEPAIGATCERLTLSDVVVAPLATRDGKRHLWEHGQIRLFDGGADGDGSTIADNTLFAVQGIFIP